MPGGRFMQRSTDRNVKASDNDRPDSFDALKQTITSHYDGLSRRLQEVGEYALAHPDDIALETIAVIASRAKVPPSSLIRFSKALGFEGFTEMQRLFRERLVVHAPSYRERISRLRDRRGKGRGTIASSMLDDFSTAGIEGLERLRQELPPERLQAAVELLGSSSLIHIVGHRRAFPVASYLTYLLSELGCRTSLLDGIGGMFEQQSRSVRRGSTLIVVSFRPYSPDVMTLVERCHEDRVPIIGITDGPLSPLARLAEVSLEVIESEVQDFRALSASMTLALALAVSLGHHLATAK
ncbi:MAG: MurR/RpiR family transcriptional regulator [Geminicoccaceae bacterium]